MMFRKDQKIISIDRESKVYSAENAIINDPHGEYCKYQKRLQKEGDNASFPEFKYTVDVLQKELHSEKVEALIKNNPTLKLQRDLVKTYLFHVGLDFIVDAENYPYPAPFKQYPYRPTIEAIQKALEFFDVVERLLKKDSIPLYHTNRYYYHSWPLLADKEVILFPTTRRLTMEDLIHVRGVPFGFLGVTTFKSSDLEKLRTSTGNLESGALLALSKGKSSGVKVRYFMDEGPATLANVYNKLVHGFYDPFNKPSTKVVPAKYRTAENLVEAAEKIFTFLEEKPLDRFTLLKYATSRNGITRKFNYPKTQFFSFQNEKNIISTQKSTLSIS